MTSPFSDEKVVAVKALVPDWAVIHVHEADEFGNARIMGSVFQDILLTRAAKKQSSRLKELLLRKFSV